MCLGFITVFALFLLLDFVESVGVLSSGFFWDHESFHERFLLNYVSGFLLELFFLIILVLLLSCLLCFRFVSVFLFKVFVSLSFKVV